VGIVGLGIDHNDSDGGTVRLFDRKLHSRMPLLLTPARLKLLHACDRWHSSRDSTSLPGDTANSIQTLKAYCPNAYCDYPIAYHPSTVDKPNVSKALLCKAHQHGVRVQSFTYWNWNKAPGKVLYFDRDVARLRSSLGNRTFALMKRCYACDKQHASWEPPFLPVDTVTMSNH
jgi:hypothetical protein